MLARRLYIYSFLLLLDREKNYVFDAIIVLRFLNKVAFPVHCIMGAFGLAMESRG